MSDQRRRNELSIPCGTEVRIGVVGPMPPLKGGISAHTSNVVQALETLGHEVVVVSWLRQFPRLIYRLRKTERDADPRGDRRFLLRWYSPLSWLRAGWSLRGCDLMVLPWFTPFHGPAQLTVMAVSRRPTIVLLHNTQPHESMPLGKALTKAFLRRAEGYVTHSMTNLDELEKLGLEPSPARTVMHPPNIRLSPSVLQPSRDGLRALFLGFIRPYKGLDIAIDALALLPESFTLTVAGEFWEGVEPWRKRIASLGLEHRVILRPGYQSDEDVEKLLATHHLVVLPYKSATQSGIVPLAFGAHRTVVATRVGGIGEVVEHGVNGILTDADPVSFAAGVAEAAERLHELSEAAARSGSDWCDVASAIVALHRAGRPPSRPAEGRPR